MIVGDAVALLLDCFDRVRGLRQAEVQHFDRAVGSQLDVRRLEIAVNDPHLVRGFERLGDLPRDGHGLVQWYRPVVQPIGERGPFDQLQDQRLDAVRFFETVDRADVRMIERCENVGFALEAREPVGIDGEELRKDLERDVAIELCVARTIDLAHAAGADSANDLVRASRVPLERLATVEPCDYRVRRSKLAAPWARSAAGMPDDRMGQGAGGERPVARTGPRALFRMLSCPPSGGPVPVRLKPDTTAF